MFDFSKIGEIGATFQEGLASLETRLTSIENLMLTHIALTAMDISERYRVETGAPADVIGIMDEARETAARWLAEIAERKARKDGTANDPDA